MRYETIQEAYKILNRSGAWFNFDLFDDIGVECDRNEYEYRYYESRLYVIRHKHQRYYWFVEAKNPGDALTKCLSGEIAGERG